MATTQVALELPTKNCSANPFSIVTEVFGQIAAAADPNSLRRLVHPLGRATEILRRHLPAGAWRVAVERLRQHPGFAVLQQDPYTSRCFEKPRGYAGDAVMLDYIYRPPFLSPPEASWQGEAVYAYTCEGSASRSVRNRRALLARTVDDLAEARGPAKVRAASLACGHLREAELMAYIDSKYVENFWAVDQDRLSVAECETSYGGRPITAIEGSVLDLLKGRHSEIHSLDLFYAAGLFDYLPDRLARKLILAMFGRLRSGGKLLIANFLPDTADRGYMEAYMDWWLIFRSEADLIGLTSGLAENAVARQRTFCEAEQNIAFLEITKA
jgi:SAM-dependent methyltransferase